MKRYLLSSTLSLSFWLRHYIFNYYF